MQLKILNHVYAKLGEKWYLFMHFHSNEKNIYNSSYLMANLVVWKTFVNCCAKFSIPRKTTTALQSKYYKVFSHEQN